MLKCDKTERTIQDRKAQAREAITGQKEQDSTREDRYMIMEARQDKREDRKVHYRTR